MIRKRLTLIIFILIGLGVNGQAHFPPKQAEVWKVVKPRLDELAQFIKNDQIDSCYQFFSPEIDKKSIKDSLIKARNSILRLKNFSHNSSGFQELNSKYLITLTYVSKGYRFLYEIEFSVDAKENGYLFKSINLKNEAYFEREYNSPNNELPPTTPPPPPSSIPPPPPK